jgi:hypothetical protein
VKPTLGAVVVAALLLLGSAGASAQAGVSAQDGTPTTSTTSSTVAELPPAEMIPRPNSGHAPEDAGDRGGALQLLVFGLVVVAIGAGVTKVVLDSRRARRS